MKLIGQYDSPFVRRVGITLTLYGIEFEHLPWSTFGDADKIAPYNPLRPVPVLVFDDGMSVMDSNVIVTLLDELAGNDAVLTRTGADLRLMLRWCALAAGAADKGVSLVYEKAFREGLAMWVDRCRAQVTDTLDLLDQERAAAGEWFGGATMSHADLLTATVFRFISEALAEQFDFGRWPALVAHSQACEEIPAFRAIYQPYELTPPKD
ncbi:glutathione S-transferase family protein [Sphingomonas asaccharolytica]|uniref:glutathione S-transferase family protein n=1 Tax=Sphingomonas asaccharolytica TaxID=40681 RepID=UPI00082BE44E|nr:glutathione S-transferase family protein [Sphingomonas asaccharolytica]